MAFNSLVVRNYIAMDYHSEAGEGEDYHFFGYIMDGSGFKKVCTCLHLIFELEL